MNRPAGPDGPPRLPRGSGRGVALLSLASVIWGFAFVAQRAGMAAFPPFLFTGMRFLAGALAVLPVALACGGPAVFRRPGLARDGLLTGLALFAAVSLQQAGLVRCEAGAAGLLTGLYVFFTPLLGRLRGEPVSGSTWRAAALAVAGLGLLALRSGGLPRLAPGEGLVLLGAVGWALHLRTVDGALDRQDPLALATLQFVVCGALALVAGALFEAGARLDFAGGWLPLLYGSLLSVAVAYTLQVVGQRGVPPALAAMVLGLESLFAALGGAWLLGERLGAVGWAGALLLVGAVSLAAIRGSGGREPPRPDGGEPDPTGPARSRSSPDAPSTGR